MSRLRLGALLLLQSMLCAARASALTISADTQTIPGLAPGTSTNLTVLRLTGMFEIGDSEKLREVLTALGRPRDAPKNGPLATAELSSSGGDVVEGVRIGYLFRDFRVATLVRRSDICLSACALAFLGGTAAHPLLGTVPDRKVEIGGQVGFHNIALNYRAVVDSGDKEPEAATKKGFGLALGGSSLIIRYATDVGVDAGLIGRILGRPATEFEYIDTAGEFVALRVCPSEALLPRLSREQQAVNLCNNALRPDMPASPSQARALSVRDARLRLLQHVEKNMTSLGVSDRFADQLHAVINSKNDNLVLQTYIGLKAIGLPLPNLAGNTFEVQGYSAGMYQMGCTVSFSQSEPDRFDLVILGPKGLAAAPHAPPASCPWLFRFDLQDVINPRR